MRTTCNVDRAWQTIWTQIYSYTFVDLTLSFISFSVVVTKRLSDENRKRSKRKGTSDEICAGESSSGSFDSPKFQKTWLLSRGIRERFLRLVRDGRIVRSFWFPRFPWLRTSLLHREFLFYIHICVIIRIEPHNSYKVLRPANRKHFHSSEITTRCTTVFGVFRLD